MTRIVIDSSALLAVLLDEADASRCEEALLSATSLLISAVTLAEAEIVANHRGIRPRLQQFIAQLKPEVAPVTAHDAHLVADVYARWGKGWHPAALNFADCFAYVLAKSEGCPLLFVGNDFARTDVLSA